METKGKQEPILNESMAASSILDTLREHKEAIVSLQERLAYLQEYIERLEDYALYFMNELLDLHAERLRSAWCDCGDTGCNETNTICFHFVKDNGGDTGGKCGGGRGEEVV